MARNPEYQQYIQGLQELAQEDRAYAQGFDPNFINHPTSVANHHRPISFWAGPLQREFGVYRRGPKVKI